MRYDRAGDHRVPIVDLARARRTDCRRVLDEVIRETGFFYVEHHGIGDALLADSIAQTHAFFALPEPAKQAIHIAKSRNNRGYFPQGEENALGHPMPDRKEGFEMGLELAADDPAVVAGTPFHGPNVWPRELPAFRGALTELYGAMRGMCDGISALLADALGLGREFFAPMLEKPMCQMRVVRYPPQDYVPVEAHDRIEIGSGPHTDYGIVSIIWQMDGPGLEIQTPQGAWLACPVIPGTLICQLGDASQIWTNDHWRATRHRVVNATGRLRHALAYFHDPAFHSPLAPLAPFVSSERPARYAPTTMGAHVTRGFDGAYAYRDWSAVT